LSDNSDRGRSEWEDPSRNVQRLNEASAKRQDDLSELRTLLFEARLECLKENIKLRSEYEEKIAALQALRLDQQASIRASYSERLELAESKRIDAIRAVDVAAVAVASQRAADQAMVLSTQVATSAEQLRTQGAQQAEALRSLVATTANTIAQAQQQIVTSLSTRITTLEQAGYQAVGKQGVVDPQMVELLAEVKSLREARREVSGVSQGISTSWAVFGAAMMLLIGLGGLGLALRSAPAPVVVAAPAPVTVPR
jgi:hypothetical protein